MERMILRLAVLGLVSSCGMAGDRMVGEFPDAGADSDADSDTDTDTDTGMDSDIDTDSDTDGDVDEAVSAEGTCSDTLDNDGDAIVDCFEFGCREAEACCGEPVDVVADPFDAGPRVDLWTPFGSPQVADSSLVMPDTDHESGVLLGTPLDSHAILDARVTVDLPADCGAVCPAYAGVGLTAQRSIGDASGVRPIAAIVLSALDDSVHGAVDGEEVWVSEPVTPPVELGLRLGANGTVHFAWTSSDASGSGDAGPATRPETDVRLAVYGRGGMRADDLDLTRAACPGPRGGVRAGAVLEPEGWDAAGVRAPSIVESGGRFVLYYDGIGGIGRAESADGVFWTRTPADPIVGARSGSPGVLDWDPGAERGRLVFVDVEQNGSGHRIDMGRSTDANGHQFEDFRPVVVPNDTIASARDPHPVLVGTDIAVYFTVVDGDGRASIGRVTSSDGGGTWGDPEVVLTRDVSDGDGLFAPAVRAHADGPFEMWFEVRDGVSSRIEYALSVDGLEWLRDGEWNEAVVLTPGSGFDARSVGDPFVLATEVDGEDVVRLYYTGAADSLVSIGLVERAEP